MLDQLNMIKSEKAQQVAFKVIDALQSEQHGHQVAAVAMVFLMMCKRYNVRPIDVLDKTGRITYDAFSEGRGEYARAIKNYMQEELK